MMDSYLPGGEAMFICRTQISELNFPRIVSLLRAGVLVWLGLSCLFPLGRAEAGEVGLAWDPPESEYGGFILSYGRQNDVFEVDEDVGNTTTYTIYNLDPGQTYYFAVKAYNPSRDSESPYSNQVSVTLPDDSAIPPAPPQGVRIIGD
jgi:hypothetical protein